MEWHHFDPPWHLEEHHRSDGMIALCQRHHGAADQGAFTVAQLHELKRRPRTGGPDIEGEFAWRRNKLLVVSADVFSLEVANVLVVNQQPVIWYSRDENGYLLLNIEMPSPNGVPRLRMRDNVWIVRGQIGDFECAPNGHKIRARYTDGDAVGLQFRAVNQLDDAPRTIQANLGALVQYGHVDLPITVVELECRIPFLGIHLTRAEAIIGDINIGQCFFTGDGTGTSFRIRTPRNDLFPGLCEG